MLNVGDSIGQLCKRTDLEGKEHWILLEDQIKKIEVGTLYTERKNDGDESYLTTYHTVNGKSVEYNYKTVKSGKTIKLGTTPQYDSDDNVEYTYYATDYTRTSNDSDSSVSVNKKISAIYAPTKIRVTYYDKITKTYHRTTETIYYKAKK